MRFRSLLSVATLAVLVPLAGASCLSPTLPLPPPDVPNAIVASTTTPGTWEVFGSCEAGATVFVFDMANGTGSIDEDLARTGSYHVTIAGAKCDQVTVSQEVDGQYSTGTGFQLAAFTPGDPGDPANNVACQ
jgi:hypothetical protein